jgi:hypothetical protein
VAVAIEMVAVAGAALAAAPVKTSAPETRAPTASVVATMLVRRVFKVDLLIARKWSCRRRSGVFFRSDGNK